MKKALLALILLAAGVPARAATWTTMLGQIRVQIKDTHASLRRYSDAQLLALANEGQREINIATWAVTKSTAYTIASGTTYYLLPTDFVVPLRATREYRLLKETTIDKQDADFSGGAWQLTGGVSTMYYLDQASPTAAGLYPWPSGSASTGTLRITYVAQTTDLVNGSDTPYNAITRLQEYAEPLIFYVAYRVFLVEGEPKADYYRKEYEAAVVNMRTRVGTKPNYSPGFSGGPSQ